MLHLKLIPQKELNTKLNSCSMLKPLELCMQGIHSSITTYKAAIINHSLMWYVVMWMECLKKILKIKSTQNVPAGKAAPCLLFTTRRWFCPVCKIKLTENTRAKITLISNFTSHHISFLFFAATSKHNYCNSIYTI